MSVKHTWEFVFNTLKGHESAFYKIFNEIISLNSKSIEIQSLCNVAIVKYMNGSYKSLILDDDPYITGSFNVMSSNHSKSCLLIFLGVEMSDLHLSLNRENFDTSSYQKYMDSVERELDSKFSSFSAKLEKLFSHKCEGKNIKDCNPNDLPFYVK